MRQMWRDLGYYMYCAWLKMGLRRLDFITETLPCAPNQCESCNPSGCPGYYMCITVHPRWVWQKSRSSLE